jgi:hypothetical protein
MASVSVVVSMIVHPSNFRPLSATPTAEFRFKDAIHSLELKIESLRGELMAAIKGIEGRLMRWTLTCLLGQTAVMAGALYFALTHLRP